MATGNVFGRTNTAMYIALAICALPGAYGLRFLYQERAILSAQAMIDQNHVIGADQTERSALLPPVSSSGDDPPRLLLASALIHAQQANAAPPASAQRDRLLHLAQQEIDGIANSRPYWGEADVVRAYIFSLTPGDGAAALAALSKSYRSAPYLLNSAAWRVHFGIEHWAALPPATQDHLINEAVWFARLQPAQRNQIMAMARDTEAYRPLLMRWRDVRLKDRDFYQRP